MIEKILKKAVRWVVGWLEPQEEEDWDNLFYFTLALSLISATICFIRTTPTEHFDRKTKKGNKERRLPWTKKE